MQFRKPEGVVTDSSLVVPRHCHCGSDARFSDPCCGNNSQRSTWASVLLTSRPVPHATAARGGLWATGDIVGGESFPGCCCCCCWIDFYSLIIAVVSALWIVTESDPAERSMTFGSRRESAAWAAWRGSCRRGGRSDDLGEGRL